MDPDETAQEWMALESKKWKAASYLQDWLPPHDCLIVIHWMFEYAQDALLNRSSLYHGLALFHQFCCKNKVEHTRLQIIANTCLWIANKFDLNDIQLDFFNRYNPEADYGDKAKSKKEMLYWDSIILNSLEFEIYYITPMNWLEWYYCQVLDICQSNNNVFTNEKKQLLAQLRSKDYPLIWHRMCFLLDMATMDISFSSVYKPSQLAAAAFCTGLFGLPSNQNTDLDPLLSSILKDNQTIHKRMRIYLQKWWDETEARKQLTNYESIHKTSSFYDWNNIVPILSPHLPTELPDFWKENK
jgi:hypothetical protein